MLVFAASRAEGFKICWYLQHFTPLVSHEGTRGGQEGDKGGQNGTRGGQEGDKKGTGVYKVMEAFQLHNLDKLYKV